MPTWTSAVSKTPARATPRTTAWKQQKNGSRSAERASERRACLRMESLEVRDRHRRSHRYGWNRVQSLYTRAQQCSTPFLRPSCEGANPVGELPHVQIGCLVVAKRLVPEAVESDPVSFHGHERGKCKELCGGGVAAFVKEPDQLRNDVLPCGVCPKTSQQATVNC